MLMSQHLTGHLFRGRQNLREVNGCSISLCLSVTCKKSRRHLHTTNKALALHFPTVNHRHNSDENCSNLLTYLNVIRDLSKSQLHSIKKVKTKLLHGVKLNELSKKFNVG